MATRKTKPSTKTTPAKVTRTARDWRVYGYYFLALIWGILTVAAYMGTLPTSTLQPSNDPHPIVDGSTAALPSFHDALLTSLLPLLPLAMFIGSIVLIRFVKARRIVLCTQLLVAIGILVYTHANNLWYASLQTYAPTPQVQTLNDAIVRRLQCGDAVRGIDNYGFGAKYFYELKDQGYTLKTTYQSNTGMLDSQEACDTYYAVRSHYPNDHIVMQLFVYDKDNQPSPYLYSNAEKGTVQYGIFVKE